MTTRLPVELLEAVFREAAAQQLDTSPWNAAALQLVSRETRDWVRPVLFYVLFVRFPPPGSHNSSSLEFFYHLLANPTAAPRIHVQHVVIVAPPGVRAVAFRNSASLVPWKLSSVAFEDDSIQLMEYIRLLSLTPDRVFLYPAVQDRLIFLVSAHWHQSQSLPSDLKELHVGWPEQSKASASTEEYIIFSKQRLRDLGHLPRVIGILANPSYSLSSRPPVQRSIVIELGSLVESDITYMKQFLEQLSHGPALRLVLVIPYPASPTDIVVMSPIHQTLCTALKAHLDETGISIRLNIALSDGVISPRNGEEYVRAVRGGWKGPMGCGTISLDEALALVKT